MTTFPASTSTSFDDLKAIKAGQHFVLRGYEYRAEYDASVRRSNGVEGVYIDATRRRGTGWELANVLETRAYVAPLSEILTDEEK